MLHYENTIHNALCFMEALDDIVDAVNRLNELENETVYTPFIHEAFPKFYQDWPEGSIGELCKLVEQHSTRTDVTYKDIFDCENETVVIRHYHLKSPEIINRYVERLMGSMKDSLIGRRGAQDWVDPDIAINIQGVVVTTKPYLPDCEYTLVGLVKDQNVVLNKHRTLFGCLENRVRKNLTVDYEVFSATVEHIQDCLLHASTQLPKELTDKLEPMDHTGPFRAMFTCGNDETGELKGYNNIKEFCDAFNLTRHQVNMLFKSPGRFRRINGWSIVRNV
jgi:hypothetical protein